MSLPFDILSYPRGAAEDLILVQTEVVLTETANSLCNAPDVAYVSHDADGFSHTDAAARYAALFDQFAVPAEKTVLVTDDETAARRAMLTGMGSVIVRSSAGIDTSLAVLRQPAAITDEPLYNKPLYTDLSYNEVASSLHKPGEINIVGIVGRTGAGKSTAIDRLVEALDTIGQRGAKFEVDSFFVRSRKDRREWLNEPDISDEERAERQRVITWWDLDRTTDTLARIRDGEHVRLDSLYDMRRGGEMVGTMDIGAGQEGLTVFVEGTALLVPELSRAIDSFVYLNTHDHVRADLLMQRNTSDGYTAEESRARKVLTDAAETNEHIALELREARFDHGKLSVLDNTLRGETLRLMPPFIPEK